MYQSLSVKSISTMTFEEAVVVSPTLYAGFRLTTDNRTYQTNFYEMTRTYPPINLLLQEIRLERNKLF